MEPHDEFVIEDDDDGGYYDYYYGDDEPDDSDIYDHLDDEIDIEDDQD